MGIETAIAAGGAILGAVGGSKSKGGGTTTTTQSSAPWQPQQEYLTKGFNAAGTALDNALANPVYTGPRVADLNGYQTSSANNLGTFADQSMGNAYSLLNAGNSNLSAGANYGNNAASLYSQYAGVDPTQSIIANANQYAANPYVDGLIDASGRDVVRQLNENTLPTLNRQFAGTGNTNSTRAGVESAIAQRGTADRLADMSSQIRSQFFGQGLNMAQNQYNQNLENSLKTNSQLLNAGNYGINAINAGQQFATNNFNQGQNAGAVYQNQNQNQLNANMAQFNEANQNPLKYIQQYMSSVGGNYGGSATGSSTTPESGGGFMGAVTGALGGALGGIGAASQAKKAGLFG